MSKHSSCPFCGSKENQTVTDDGIGWVKCNGCGATGPIFSKYSGEEDREYISWESRAEAQALREELKNRTSECNGLHEMLRQEHDRTEKARDEVAALRRFAGEIYQVLGALDAPENVLDNASDAANGDKLRHKTLLPFAALRARVVVLPSVDNVMNIVMRYQWNEKTNVTGTTNWAANLGMKVVDEVKRLNGKAVSEADIRPKLQAIADGLRQLGQRMHSSELNDAASTGRLATRALLELNALLGEGKEHE